MTAKFLIQIELADEIQKHNKASMHAKSERFLKYKQHNVFTTKDVFGQTDFKMIVKACFKMYINFQTILVHIHTSNFTQSNVHSFIKFESKVNIIVGV